MVTRLFAILLLAVSPATVALADDAPLGPRPLVLLLRNGEVIEGQVTLSGDRYDVAMKNSELHIRVADVRLTGHDRTELYRQWRDNLEHGKVQEHLDLAEWCIKNRLHSEAKAEISAASEADSTHPKITLLERRLELIDRPAAAKPARATTAGSATPALVSNDELDKLVRSLPTGSMETFVTSVQPLLLNHCSTAGCHGPQSQTSLRLQRISPTRVTGRRQTQRNLYAALSAIDRNNPDESPLLLVPTQPHATLKTPIFTNRDAAQYKQLVAWVQHVSGATVATKTSPPASLSEHASPLLQKVERSPRQERSAREEQELDEAKKSPSDQSEKSVTDPSSADDRLGPADEEPSPTAAKSRGGYSARPKLQHGAQREQFVPRDEFDPEIFNRRYFGK